MADKVGGILARLGTPDGADVSTDIAAVLAAIGGLGGANQTVTITEQEPMVAGDIAIAAGTDAIPLSSLDDLIATVQGGELDNVIGGNDTDMAVDWVTDNIAVFAYADADVGAGDGTVTPVKYEADGSVVVGSNFVFETVALAFVDITAIGNARFATLFTQGSPGWAYARAGQLNIETLYITFGAAALLENVNCDAGAICAPDNDKFCAIYADATNSDGNLIAGTVNPTTLVITKGAIVEILATIITNVSITKVDTNKIAAAYGGTDSDGFCVIATISGTTITDGTPIEFADAATIQGTSICALSTASIAIAVVDDTASNNIESYAATISGTVPTFGSKETLSSTTNSAFPQIIALDGTYFLVVMDDAADSRTDFIISSVSGNTVTKGTLKSFVNDIPATQSGKCMKINSYNDIVYFGITGSVTYAVMMDIGWKDGTYTLDDILGVAEDAAGTVIVDGIDEGNASNEEPSMTYFWDGQYRCVRKKNHSCQYKGYIPRVRVVAPDALKAIGG